MAAPEEVRVNHERLFSGPFIAFSIAATAALSAPACASKPGEFPTQGELSDLAAQVAPTGMFGKSAVDVSAWELKGPLADTIEATAHDGSSPWDKLLKDLAASRTGLLFMSESAHCLARETAAFLVEKKALPPEPLQGFMAARCGAPSRSFAIQVLSGEVAKETTDDKLAADWHPKVGEMIRATAGHGSQAAGVAFVRGETRAAVVVVAQDRRVLLEKTSLFPDTENHIVLKGELLAPAAQIRGIANQGRFGFADCTINQGVKLPSFELICAVKPEDESARITVAAYPPGRILGATVADMLVFPAGATTTRFEPPAQATGGALDGAGLAEALNGVRKEAGLALVEHDAAQAGVVGKLSPFYFAAALGLMDATIADKVVLGVRAGWEVNGLVQEGDFASIVAPGAKTAAEVIDTAIAAPATRSALLDPEIRRIAIGTVIEPASNTAAALFGTYVLADPSKHEKEAAAVIARITRLRAAKKLPAPEIIGEVAGHAARVAQQIDAGEATPDEALNDLMKQSVQTLSSGVQGFALSGSSTAQLSIPDALLSRPTLRLAIAVGHYKVKNEPWTKLAVLLVLPAEGSRQTAHGPATRFF